MNSPYLDLCLYIYQLNNFDPTTNLRLDNPNMFINWTLSPSETTNLTRSLAYLDNIPQATMAVVFDQHINFLNHANISEEVLAEYIHLNLGAGLINIAFQKVSMGEVFPEIPIQHWYWDEAHRVIEHLIAVWTDPAQQYYYTTYNPADDWGWVRGLFIDVELEPLAADLDGQLTYIFRTTFGTNYLGQHELWNFFLDPFYEELVKVNQNSAPGKQHTLVRVYEALSSFHWNIPRLDQPINAQNFRDFGNHGWVN